ncbi:MAG: hypothetical protein ACRESW_11305, partial [Nevskiales bacterium]
MNRSIVVSGAFWGLVTAAALPITATAAESDEARQIRQEIQQLRQEYEQRIQALEQKLQQSEAARAQATAASPPSPASSSASNNAFNPKISLILQGSYADFGSDTEPDMPGFILGPETELRSDGFSLGETELAIEANVDDKFHGWATIALENEDGETVVAVEEAYLNTLTLPKGFALKFGRFFSDTGYLNHVHSHAWDFADQPLVYRAFFANQLKDDGLQLRWVAPTDLFFEAGTELLRGDGFPAGGEKRSGVNLSTVFAHVGGDVGTDHSWRAGISHINADADDRRSGEDIETSFTGDSDITGLDLVWKWAPDGNPAIRNFVFQTEYFVRDEDGSVVFDPDGVADTSTYDGKQKGFYVQGIYQWMPRWRVGLRYDRLSANNSVPNPVAGTSLKTLADNRNDPERWSLMTDFSNSEFSRLRLQYNRDESRP